jgi:putative hydrolase of the HAD superfamily
VTLRAVFFDVDDTLVDYTGAARAGFAEVLGPGASYERWLELDHLDRFYRGEFDFQTMRHTRMRDFLAELGRHHEDAVSLEAYRFETVAARCALFDDVLPCLTLLRDQGLRIGLITNNEPEYQRAKILKVGLQDLVDTIVISGEIGVTKPDPAIFEHACDLLGIPAEQAMHVGDNLDADVRGAIEAGLRGVWLNRNGSTADPHPGARMITGLGQLPTMLDL